MAPRLSADWAPCVAWPPRRPPGWAPPVTVRAAEAGTKVGAVRFLGSCTAPVTSREACPTYNVHLRKNKTLHGFVFKTVCKPVKMLRE